MPKCERNFFYVFLFYLSLLFQNESSLVKAEIKWKSCFRRLPVRSCNNLHTSLKERVHEKWLVAQSSIQHVTASGLDNYIKILSTQTPAIAGAQLIAVAKTSFLAAAFALTGRTIASRWIAVKAGQEV